MMAPVFLNSVAVIHSSRKRGNSHHAAESVYQHFHCADLQSKKQKEASLHCVFFKIASESIFGKKAVEKIVAYTSVLPIIKLTSCGKAFHS
ncbi:MAG: hypothetical protein PHY54_17275 [Methylococcales bacterium]|nr:hypothetical protein [Methylococcales bacterium]